MAPLYVYSQLDGGKNGPTFVDENMGIEMRQGVDTLAHYQPRGNSDYKTEPGSTGEMARESVE